MSKSRMIIETARNLRAKILNEGIRDTSRNETAEVLGVEYDPNNQAHAAHAAALHNMENGGNDNTRLRVKRYATQYKLHLSPKETDAANEQGGIGSAFRKLQQRVIDHVRDNHKK